MDNRGGVLLEVALPRRNPRDSFIARELFNAWYGIRADQRPFKRRARLSLEVEATRGRIVFRVWSVARWAQYVTDQMRAKYPECRVVVSQESCRESRPRLVRSLRLKRPAEYPIQTQKNYDASDPMAGLLSSMISLHPDERLLLQLICRPLSARRTRSLLRRSIGRRRAGIQEDSRRRRLAEERTRDRSDFEDYQLKAMETKAGENGYQVALRIGAWAPSKRRASLMAGGVIAALAEVSVGSLNGFTPARAPQVWTRWLFQNRLLGWRSRTWLGISELPSLWHFPHENARLPYVAYQPARVIRAPRELGQGDPLDTVCLGVENAVDNGQRIRLRTPDRFRHLYVLGKTGVGKTTLLAQLVLQDAVAGRGAILLDPKGDLVDAVLSHLPKQVASRTLLLDPSRLDRPAALNVLDVDPRRPLEVSLTVDALVSTFIRLYGPEAIGPRTQQLLRQGALVCIANHRPLLEISSILVDDARRAALLRSVPDGPTRQFWLDVYPAWASRQRQEFIAPLLNKLDRFAADAILRPLLGQARSTICFDAYMRDCRLVLIDLNPARVGDENSRLLGQLLLTRIWMARRRAGAEAMPPTFLYCDEFQQIVSPVFEEMLSLGRSHGLAITLAHQYVEQLDDIEPKVEHAVFGNVGNVVSFRVGPASAEVLAGRFQNRFDPDDLQLLDPYEFAGQLVWEGRELEPFSGRTLPFGSGSPEPGRQVRVCSARRLGRPWSVVARELSDDAVVGAARG